jgi:hypothetical protein
MDRAKQENVPLDENLPREIEFFVIDADFDCEKLPGPKITGTLIDQDIVGTGLLTALRLQPGNIVKFNHGGGRCDVEH